MDKADVLALDVNEVTQMIAFYLEHEKTSPLDDWNFTVYGAIGEIEFERFGKKFMIEITEIED